MNLSGARYGISYIVCISIHTTYIFSAAVYRSLNEMDTGSGAAAGTVSKGAVAVIVQEMVFGNLNKCSCTGEWMHLLMTPLFSRGESSYKVCC